MLKFYDQPTDHGIRIGDLARFPLNLREPEKLYPANWIVTHFTLDKTKTALIGVRRLADGVTKTVGGYLFNQYRIDSKNKEREDLWSKVAKFRRDKLSAGKCDCLKPHSPDEHFYVTVVDGTKVQILFGPYEHHGHAIQDVTPAKKIANDIDYRSHFYSFGTTGFSKTFNKPGILEGYREKYGNRRIG